MGLIDGGLKLLSSCYGGLGLGTALKIGGASWGISKLLENVPILGGITEMAKSILKNPLVSALTTIGSFFPLTAPICAPMSAASMFL